MANRGLAHNEAMLKRVRDYAIEEPSFTVAFAAWDLSRTGEKIATATVRRCVDELLKDRTIRLIEDGGRMGKVYAYAPSNGRQISALPVSASRIFTELDESRRAGDLAPVRGRQVAHTRARGSSGKPGKDKRRQEQGWKIKRGRQGT